MSSDSFAILRNSLGPDLSALAEQHMQHDLQDSDRTALQTAARTVSLHASIGSALGVGLGLFLAYRLRRGRQGLFNALKNRGPGERPTAVRFADGHERALPDNFNALSANALKPSAIGGVLTYTLLGAGGLFLGGETGLLTGSFRARQTIAADRESRERIQRAFRRFQADALRTQANLLDSEGGEGGSSGWRF